MHISKKGEYALRAMIRLAMTRDRRPQRITDVAAAERISPKFLEQIFLQLTRAGLLRSKRGKGGGYVFAAPPNQISIGRIVRLIDGPLAPLGCVSQAFHVPCAREKNCALHDVMLDVRNAIARILDTISLTDICARFRQQQKSRGKNKMNIPVFLIGTHRSTQKPL
jgi:Rrf2 family protein